MIAKPKHLGREYAEQFQDRSVASAYRYRISYPAETFTILAGLITDEPRTVLDAGCGTGAIARNLVASAERIDAVDFSPAMIAEGKRLPHGDAANLQWIEGPVEEVTLHPPYALVTAGSSLQWFDWDVVLPRFGEVLTPNGYLAMAFESTRPPPWHATLCQIIPRFSTNQDYAPYDVVEELERRGLFRKQGERQTEPVPFAQSIDGYIEAFHAMNGFSRERMTADAASAFDQEVRQLVTPFSQNGQLVLQIVASVIWGKPGRPAT